MQWLNKVVDEAIARQPEGEILVESGVSPSGTYHVGTLREVLTSDAIMLGIRRRGRQSRHIHYVDDLDPFRKVPVNVPENFSAYLGWPLADVPAPDGSAQSYADYFLNDFLLAAKKLHLEMDVIRSHEKYRTGGMVEPLELALHRVADIKQVLEKVSGRQLDENWAPIQVMEDGYLKNRRFVSIDTGSKAVTYLDAEGAEQTVSYNHGEVKLNWRVDWPARWWQLKVDVEPFGRDHATKGGSYDTGAEIIRAVFGAEPPMGVPYNFINLTGETKKMSKSTGHIISISELTEVLPPEVIRYFVFRYPPGKQLFFDQVEGVTKLIDDYAALLAKEDKSEDEKLLIDLSGLGADSTVSSIPFSHLVASYQATLKNSQQTLEVIRRTEHGARADAQEEVILKELIFIDNWLERWAPEDVKFELQKTVSENDFSEEEKNYLGGLADKIAAAPEDADGEWFHKAVYEFKDSHGLEPKRLFETLYRALIGKSSGPRAGWFLYILPRDWLIKRLRLEG